MQNDRLPATVKMDRATFGNSDTAYNPHMAQSFETESHSPAHHQPSPLAQPTTAYQPSSAYPQYPASYGYADPEAAPDHSPKPNSASYYFSHLQNLKAKDKRRLYWYE